VACVDLDDHDITPDGVPALCMKCGEPAAFQLNKKFQWNPGWVYFILLVGVLPFVIVALVMTWRRRVCTPFCDRHRGYWRFRTIFMLGGVLVILAAVITVGVSVSERMLTPPLDMAALVAVALLAILWLFSAAIIQSTSIRATEITHERITLAGVHPIYVAAVHKLQDHSDAQELDPTIRHKNWPRSQRSEFYDD
jgi:hypothetical protein